MNKKVIIGSIIALVVIVVGVLGYQNQMEKQSDENVIKIGAILPLTGNMADVGASIKEGLQLAQDSINMNEGYAKYDIVFQDSKGDAKGGNFALQQILIGKKPDMIISLISGVTLGIQKTTEDKKILLFGTIGAKEFITDKTKFSYRLLPSPEHIGKSLVREVKKINISKIAILYPNNEFGNSYASSAEDSFKKGNIEVVNTTEYESDRKSYSSVFAKLLQHEFECVYLVGLGNDLGELIKKLRENGYVGKIICDMNLIPPAALHAGEAIHNVLFLDFAEAHGVKYDDFTKTYKERYQKYPEMPAIVNFEVFFLYDYILKKIGESAWVQKDKIEQIKYNSMLGVVSIDNYEVNFPLELKDAKTLIKK